MASTEALRVLLFRINNQILQHPTFTRDGGVPVDDPAYYRESQELERASLQLGLILRELKQKANLLNIRTQGARFAPLDQRFRVSSMKGQHDELRSLNEMARNLQKTLEDLIRKNGNLGEGETAEKLAEFIEKIFKQAETHSETHDVSHGLEYTNYHAPHVGGLEGIVIPIFILLRVLNYLRRNRKK